MLPGFCIPMVSGAALEAETAAWVAEVVNNGGTVSDARTELVNDLIINLKADGIWSKLDRLWLFAAEDEESALTDLVGLTLATSVNSTTFTVDEGYTGNGSDMSINTNFDASSGSPKWQQDDAMYALWNLTTGSVNTCHFSHEGAGANLNDVWFLPHHGPGSIRTNILSSNVDATIASEATGLYVVSRVNSTDVTIDIDGVELDTVTTVSTSVTAGTFRILKAAGPTGYSSRQVACCAIGGGLSVGERGDIYTHLQTYMTAVGL